MKRLLPLLISLACAEESSSPSAQLIDAQLILEAALDLGASDWRPRDLKLQDLHSLDSLPDLRDGEVEAGLTLEMIQEGKGWLKAAQPHMALLAFEAALARAPESQEALFGAALAGALDNLELSSMLLSVLTEQLKEPSRGQLVGESFHAELMKIRAGFLLALQRSRAVDPDSLAFDVEGVWIYLGIQANALLQGRFRGGDLHLFRAAISGVTALSEVLATQSFGEGVLEAASIALGGSTSMDLPNISALLIGILRPDPSFLTLHPEEGAEIFQSAGLHLAAVGSELNAAVRWMRQAPSSESEVPLVSDLVERGGGPHLIIRSVLEGEERNTRSYVLDLKEETLAALERTSSSFASPGAAVSWSDSVAVLSVILHYGIALGLLEGLGPDLSVLPREALELMLFNLMNLPLALDFGRFFQQPVGLRLFLPDLHPEEPRFLIEWECPEDLDTAGYPSGSRGFLCGEEALLEDRAHFEGALEADDQALGSPYFYWSDPSWGGLLLLDFEGEQRLMDLQHLNGIIASILSSLLSLLSSLP